MAISFDALSSTDFEALCADLLRSKGFINVDWRKGTGLKSSPADSGRDIVCQHLREDPDGSKHLEKWFVDCKHFRKGVPPKELQNLLAWSEAQRPDYAVFMVSNFLTNPAKDYIEAYVRNNHPPFKIRYWEKPQLVGMLRPKIALQRTYNLTNVPIRSINQILKAEDEFYSRVWYDRHQMLASHERQGKSKTPKDIMKAARAAAREVEAKYGKKSLGPYSDMEWGMINGKLSALRWVLGDDWDMLDS
jgi:HJR/Mrr/RecB family endonuclease